MPSLLGTLVTANYGRMLPQDTYAQGADFSAFGTRPMRALLVTLSGVTRGSMILQDGSTADASLTAALGFVPSLVGWKQPNSLFSRIVRTVAGYGEIYVVGQPNATDVLLLVSADTFNGADSGNTQGTGFGLLEAAIAAEIGKTNKADGTGTNTSAATVAVTSSGTSNFFVGALIANIA
jgi:hypothetical protein